MSAHIYEPVGSARELFYNSSTEVLLSGAAGTGKSRACLEKIMFMAFRYPNSRYLIVRKTAESLTKSALQTLQNFVLLEALASGEVRFYGGSPKEPTQFKFGNGSAIMTGGMDKASRIMSTEFDVIYVQEATELTEDDFEKLTTRMRNNKTPFQQIIADCNPSHPQHWLKKRCDAGKTQMIYCRHEDNPTLFASGAWTEAGRKYLAVLDSLSGVNRERLRYGKWVAAEGLVYDEFDPQIHIYDRVTPFTKDHPSWQWYFSVDFGFTNPFVCQMWCQDSDGRLYLFREIYQTGKTVQEHAKDILSCMADKSYYGFKVPRPKAIVCDSADPEGMEVLRRELGMNVVKAKKDVPNGIQLVKERLKVQADGKPRIYICRKALYRPDPELEKRKKPTCSEDEILAYVWSNKGTKEEPLKADDHGMDAMRYVVSHIDSRPGVRIRWIDY